MPTTSIIIPCYNESKRLNGAAFLAFAEQRHDLEFRFVDDGSSDETLAILRDLEGRLPDRIRATSLSENQGKAEAVRQGMIESVEEGFRFVGFWDADLATPLESIPVFCDVLRRRPQIDVVVGTRMSLLGHQVSRKRMRSLCGRVFATASIAVLGNRLYDTQCGAKLFRVNRCMQRWLSRPFQSRWIFDVELLARLKVLLESDLQESLTTDAYLRDQYSLANRVFELPLDGWHDVAGSKLKSSDFIRAASELARLFWHYRIRRGTRFLEELEREPAIQTWRDWQQVPATDQSDQTRRAA